MLNVSMAVPAAIISLARNVFPLRFCGMNGSLLVALGIITISVCAVGAAEVSSPLESLSAPNASELRFATVSFSDLQEYASSDRTDWIDGQQLAVAPLPRVPVAAPIRRMALVSRDGSKEVLGSASYPMSVQSRYHVSGEMGALFGVSTGKYGATSEAGYIVGGVGNDKFEITAGASYENTTYRMPRYGR
jgi:hypothetical protein